MTPRAPRKKKIYHEGRHYKPMMHWSSNGTINTERMVLLTVRWFFLRNKPTS